MYSFWRFKKYLRLSNEVLNRSRFNSSESKREKLIESYHILLEREYCKQSRVPEVLVYEEATKKHNETHIISSFQNISKEIPEDVFR